MPLSRGRWRLRSRFRKFLTSALASTFFVLALFLSSIPLFSKDNEDIIINVTQGDAFLFKIEEGGDVADIKGSILGRDIPFFRYEEMGLYGALIGIDMEDEAKTHDLRVEISKKDGESANKTYLIKVIPGRFLVEELTMPKDVVELDDESLKRVAIEKKKVAEIFSGVTGKRFWKGDFTIPAEGRLVENFGFKRKLNGLQRAPHAGVDISAPAGTEIHASNDGIVVMVDDLFFSGKSIFVDHGLGVYTFYSHLSKVNVSLGDRIKRGDLIGLVGSSGRATGPHLHWGMKINGARVNPLSVTRALQE